MSTPRMVGNIITIEWLAHQMGLPVEHVRQKIEQAERRDRLDALVQG